MKKIVVRLFMASALALAGCSSNEHMCQITRQTGIVLDSQGHPVADATVEIYRKQSFSAYLPPTLELKGALHTDDQGKFQFPVFDPTTVVVARKAGLAPGMQDAWHLKQDDRPVMLILTRPAEIAGTVVDENGRPVAGAEVWASKVSTVTSPGGGRLGGATLTGQPARQLFSTHTATDGEFHLIGLPAGCGVNLAVTKRGMAMRGPKPDSYGFNPLGTQCLAGQTNVKLSLEAGAHIQGKVIVQKEGQALGGVTLWLRARTAAFSFYNGREPVRSAPDGTFDFGDVPSGSYTIIACDGLPADAMPSWVMDPVQIKVVAGQNLTGVQISAVKGGVLNVNAVDRTNGKPLSGVSIAADKRFYQASATTDAKGTVQFRLPAGEYHFSAMKDYWSLEQGQATVENDRTNRSQIELIPPLALKGTVFGPSGRPAANVRVSLGSFAGGTKTDLQGRFELLWNPRGISSGTKQFLFARDWEGNLAAEIEVGPTSTNLNLQLQPGLALSGLVTDQSGKPLAKAQLALTLYFSARNGSWQSSIRGFDNVPYQTDDRGRFTYAVLPQGLDYGIGVSAKGYGTAGQRVTSTETTTNQLELRFVLQTANLKLAGQAVDANGKPLAGAELTLSGKGQPYCSAQTDINGHFAFKQLCAGEVQVGALYQGHFTNILAKVGQTNLIIKIGN